MKDTIRFMKKLDAQYRKISGLSDQRFYNIFYSQIVPCPVLILGHYPIGNPETLEAAELASRAFHKNGEHEYVDCEYPHAKIMNKFLSKTMSLNNKKISRIPKVDLVFRRILRAARTKLAYIDEARPVFEKILQRVDPSVVICEGNVSLEKFVQHYCENTTFKESSIIKAKSGIYWLEIYKGGKGTLPVLGKKIKILGLGYPTIHYLSKDWLKVEERSKKFLKKIKIPKRKRGKN